MQRFCFPLERNGAALKPWASPPSSALETAVVVIDRMTAEISRVSEAKSEGRKAKSEKRRTKSEKQKANSEGRKAKG